MFMQRSLSTLLFCSLALAACSKSGAPAEAPAEPGDSPVLPGADEPSSAERPSLTAEECTDGGGEIIGDIGDGAIHRPDYLCASGAKPTGSIRAPEGGPIAIEGQVCCPK
jgi:hypothetical protein